METGCWSGTCVENLGPAGRTTTDSVQGQLPVQAVIEASASTSFASKDAKALFEQLAK